MYLGFKVKMKHHFLGLPGTYVLGVLCPVSVGRRARVPDRQTDRPRPLPRALRGRRVNRRFFEAALGFEAALAPSKDSVFPGLEGNGKVKFGP